MATNGEEQTDWRPLLVTSDDDMTNPKDDIDIRRNNAANSNSNNMRERRVYGEYWAVLRYLLRQPKNVNYSTVHWYKLTNTPCILLLGTSKISDKVKRNRRALPCVVCGLVACSIEDEAGLHQLSSHGTALLGYRKRCSRQTDLIV